MSMGVGDGQKSRMALSEINVTPLVDVMLVLLIIFMVTAPMLQQGIEVNLPKTAPTGVEVSDEPFILVIKRDRKIMAGTAAIPIANLKTKLEAIFSTRSNKQVYIQADKAVDYGIVAEAMAEIKSAGISNIGLMTMPKTEP